MKRLLFIVLAAFSALSSLAQSCDVTISQSPNSTICAGDSVELTVTQTNPAWGLYYENDFETSVGSEWSTTTTRLYNGGTVLGEFGNSSATLNLTGLPSHDSIRVEFDLYIADTWDGNGGGPDTWNLTMGGTNVINATFAACCTGSNGGQSYPDNIPASNNAETGATTTGLPDFFGSGDGTDLYEIIRAVETSSGTYAIQFSATGLQSLSDESWGIDNVKIYLYSSNVFDDILWTTGETTETITVSPTETTSYSVTVDNGFSLCLDEVDVEVLNAQITQNDTIICSGDSVVLSVESGFCALDTASTFSLMGTYDGKQYYLSDAAVTWGDAFSAANTYGGDILTITSAGENAFILGALASFTATNIWLGATSDNPSTQFEWINGESWVYDNWAAGEPNSGSEEYIEFFQTNGEWNNVFLSVPAPQRTLQLILEISEDCTDGVLWSTGSTEANITVTPTVTTTYTVTVDNGITTCTDSVTVPVLPLSTDTLQQTVCESYT